MSLTNDDVWFSGPVKDAISLVNERNCVFLVYIHDDSEKTNALNSTLKDEKVTKVIEEKTVALAMKKDSENASLFSQFYPVRAIPVLYFIKRGTIRDFGTETITSEEIIDKINSLSGSRTVSPSPTAPSRNQVQESRNQVPAMPPQVYTTSDPDPIQDHNATELASPDKPPDVSQSEQSKKAELQKQLEKIRKERAERERNEAKEREIIRRQEAKMMQEARQTQQEKENKVYFAKIKKERLENEAHRKKVKEQIARDRAEKIAQRNAERQQRHQQQASSSSTEYTVKATSSNSTYSSHSNLSIRQLDGSNIRHQFEATATLSNIKDWIDIHRTDNGRKPYKLYSQFPARLFTEEEDTMTLEELNLCPSATIIMKLLKPTRSSSSFLSSNSNGTTSDNQSNIIVRSTLSVLDFIYGLIVALLNLFSSALGTLFPTNGLAHQENASSQQQQSSRAFRHLRGGQRLGGEPITTAGESSSTNIRRNDHDQESSQRRLNNNNPYATRIKTLHEEDEEDEKNKKRPTYNGNSVNQE
ncbi:MAG: hypothetical protein EXX96DRAFT_648574 [Benjaminiella poitrasii]|nr:MAG: hypothetical protein EXX96DRAFT_648574 [Benjaminiella poitrasii]